MRATPPVVAPVDSETTPTFLEETDWTWTRWIASEWMPQWARLEERLRETVGNTHGLDQVLETMPLTLVALAEGRADEAASLLELLARRLVSEGVDLHVVLSILWTIQEEIYEWLESIELSEDDRKAARRALVKLNYFAALIAGEAAGSATRNLQGEPEVAGTDVLAQVDLMGGILMGEGVTESPFWTRLCQSVCTSTRVSRAALFIYEEEDHLFHGVGAFGLDEDLIRQISEPLYRVPLAERALKSRQVIVADQTLPNEIPSEYIPLFNLTTLGCAPMIVGERWVGIIMVDLGGEPFILSRRERDTLRLLAKIAALAGLSAKVVMRESRIKALQDRITLARDIHDRVVQRLFGVSAALGNTGGLATKDMDRCRTEIGSALMDLRSSLALVLKEHDDRPVRKIDSESLKTLAARFPMKTSVQWSVQHPIPSEICYLIEDLVQETLTNTRKHSGGSRAWVRGEVENEWLLVEVEDDGPSVPEREVRFGLGLHLLSRQVLGAGGELHQLQGEHGWLVRCQIPLDPSTR